RWHVRLGPPRKPVRNGRGYAHTPTGFHPVVTTPLGGRLATVGGEDACRDTFGAHSHGRPDREPARDAEGCRQRRAEAHRAGAAPACHHGRARARSTRGADPPGLLLD